MALNVSPGHIVKPKILEIIGKKHPNDLGNEKKKY